MSQESTFITSSSTITGTLFASAKAMVSLSVSNNGKGSNSNPLSLNFALSKLNNLSANSKRKLILLGDMLELGKHSKKFHRKAAEFINHTEIDKVYVYGKDVIETFNKIRPQKRGKILNSKEDIYNFMIKDIKNGEYLMIKGSNSTGLNRISQNLKKGKLNAF